MRRQRSRSPRGAKIHTLIVNRERARFDKDFAQADALREELKGLGVTVFDKTNSWQSNDGRSGRVPKFGELDQLDALSDPVSANPAAAKIHKLIVDRERARFDKDFELADALREELKGLGVTVFDKTSSWQSTDGRSGRVPKFGELDQLDALSDPVAANPEAAKIHTLIANRERARFDKDFAQADALREELKALGVTVFDKTSSWQSTDGRSGRVPKFAELEQLDALSDPVAANPETGPELVEDSDELRYIKNVIARRERARATKDFDEADTLRQELQERGIEIQDKEKMWRGPNGLAGVIIGYLEGGEASNHEATVLVQQREKARQNKEFDIADMIRAELRMAGIEIYDKEKVWRSSKGISGPIPLWDAPLPVDVGYGPDRVYHAKLSPQSRSLARAQPYSRSPPPPTYPPPPPSRPPSGPGSYGKTASGNRETREALTHIKKLAATQQYVDDNEIQRLVNVREQMRKNKDFSSSDQLRDALKTIGVELREKEKWWQTSDGRSGEIPKWS